MACDKHELIHAYLDGELDPPATLAIEQHLEGCAECRALAESVRSLSASLRTQAHHRPARPGLERRVMAALDREEGDKPTSGWLAKLIAGRRQWFAGAALGFAVAAAIALAIFVLMPSDDDTRLIDDLATAHIRSLMPEHLIDLASSDRHAVRPWFTGKVDVAPPVADLSGQGYALVGGRADVIDGKRVAVVVYRNGDHVLNLFVWSAYDAPPPGIADRDGYHFVMWTASGLVFCAVSDTPVSSLQAVAKAVNASAVTMQD